MVFKNLNVIESPLADDRFSAYSGKRVLTSGSLTYNSHKNGDFIAKTLNALRPGFVLHGGDDGADRWVQLWCLQSGTPFAIIPCHMQGIMRLNAAVNRQHMAMFMLDPEMLLAFPGCAPGVLDKARLARVPILLVNPEMFEIRAARESPPKLEPVD